MFQFFLCFPVAPRTEKKFEGCLLLFTWLRRAWKCWQCVGRTASPTFDFGGWESNEFTIKCGMVIARFISFYNVYTHVTLVQTARCKFLVLRFEEDVGFPSEGARVIPCPLNQCEPSIYLLSQESLETIESNLEKKYLEKSEEMAQNYQGEVATRLLLASLRSFFSEKTGCFAHFCISSAFLESWSTERGEV